MRRTVSYTPFDHLIGEGEQLTSAHWSAEETMSQQLGARGNDRDQH